MKSLVMICVGVGFLALWGCGPNEEVKDAGPVKAQGLNARDLFLKEAPGGAQEVAEVRASVVAGTEVTVRGKIKDFVPGFAAFTLADHSLLSCDQIPGDECATPWDYCCADPDELTKGLLTIEVEEAAGKPFRQSLKGFEGLDHLQSLIIRGKASRDEAGNVRIAASGIARESGR